MIGELFLLKLIWMSFDVEEKITKKKRDNSQKYFEGKNRQRTMNL